jgi:hypothetical protein
MTKLLEKALEAVSRLPSESQDEIARAMMQLAEFGGEPEPVDPSHLPAVLEGLAQARRRAFAGDTEVEAAFRRFDS